MITIRCPGCGREYPPDRFRFGRAHDCACGVRVGRRLKRDLPVGHAAPRFIADAMLGRLARWLRALGYDTAYDAGIQDAELVRRGVEEGRAILTRDRSLRAEWWVDGCLLLEAQEPLEQLREVVRRYSLDWRSGLFSRCLVCNTPLEPMRCEELSDGAESRVPPAIRAARDEFTHCPGCGRVYWEGSHTDRMRRRLRRSLGGR